MIRMTERATVVEITQAACPGPGSTRYCSNRDVLIPIPSVSNGTKSRLMLASGTHDTKPFSLVWSIWKMQYVIRNSANAERDLRVLNRSPAVAYSLPTLTHSQSILASWHLPYDDYVDTTQAVEERKPRWGTIYLNPQHANNSHQPTQIHLRSVKRKSKGSEK